MKIGEDCSPVEDLANEPSDGSRNSLADAASDLVKLASPASILCYNVNQMKYTYIAEGRVIHLFLLIQFGFPPQVLKYAGFEA